MPTETETHEWHEVQFVYGGWIECSCGMRPYSQEEFDKHTNDHNIKNAG